jgi:hypothetical protein
MTGQNDWAGKDKATGRKTWIFQVCGYRKKLPSFRRLKVTQATCSPHPPPVGRAPYPLGSGHRESFSQGFVICTISVSIATSQLAGPPLASGQNCFRLLLLPGVEDNSAWTASNLAKSASTC